MQAIGNVEIPSRKAQPPIGGGGLDATYQRTTAQFQPYQALQSLAPLADDFQHYGLRRVSIRVNFNSFLGLEPLWVPVPIFGSGSQFTSSNHRVQSREYKFGLP
jgi:hypothetical protein